MILEKIEIESFGKFKDFTLCFESGINVLYGVNEAGKSTICAFLQAMFYDLPSSKQKYTLREDMRKRYMPWQGGDMSGTVHFSHEGKRYILKRRMGKTPRSTKVSLYDAESWEEIKDERRENPGEYFMGVGEDGFLKTIYISQLGAPIERSKNDEIIEKLSNLRQSGDEDVSYQKTVDILTKQKHSLISVGGGAGKIIRLKEERELLKEKLDDALKIEELYKNAIIKKTEEEKKKEELLKIHKDLTHKKALADEYKKYQTLKDSEKRLETIEEEKDKALLELKKSDEKLEATKSKKAELEFLDNIEASAPQILSELDARNVISEQKLHLINERKEEVKKLEEEIEKLAGEKNSRINVVMFFIAVLILAVGIVASFAVSFLFALLFIPAVLMCIFSFVPSKKSREAQQKIASLSLELERIKPGIEEENRILTEQKRNKEKAEDILKRAHALSLADLLKKLSERDTIDELLSSCVKENAFIKDHIARLEGESLKLKETLDKSEFSDAIKNYSGEAIQEIDKKLTNVQDMIVVCEKNLTEAETTLNSLSKSEKSSAELMTEIEIINRETDEFQKLYDATDKALTMIEESYEVLKSDFAPLLSEKVKTATLSLTDGKYTDVRISDDYTLKVESDGEITDAGFLSGGTYDILYLSLRMGILKILFDDKLPFLILDDAFLQLDDERAKTAATYIKKELCGQLIYFTCHRNQTELFGKENVNIINL